MAYINKDGGWIERRSNWSVQKEEILTALLELERGTATPTAWDDHLKVGFFDVAAIAWRFFGESVFIDGKLGRGKRASLNRTLGALYNDGYITKIGAPYRGSEKGLYRDFHKNHWAISHLGVKVLSICMNGGSRRWMREHRFYSVRGIDVDRAQVKRIAANDYAEDWD